MRNSKELALYAPVTQEGRHQIPSAYLTFHFVQREKSGLPRRTERRSI